MKKNMIHFFLLFCLVFGIVCMQEAFARERVSSGSFQGPRGSGSFQRNVNRTRSQAGKNTIWQNERGQGSRQAQKNWDREKGTGGYSAVTTNTLGKTVSHSGTVTKNDDGSYSKQGTITGAIGHTAAVDATVTKNENGTRSVTKTYEGPEGKTLDVDKTIQNTETGRNVSGSYYSNTGKSGTVESTKTISEGTVTKEQAVTNQYQEAWQRNVERRMGSQTITSNVRTTDPEGEEHSFVQSVTIDRVESR